MDERDFKAMNKNAQKDVKPMEEKNKTRNIYMGISCKYIRPRTSTVC